MFLSFWNTRTSAFLHFDSLHSACFEDMRHHEEEGPNHLKTDSYLLSEAGSRFLSPLHCCLCNLIVLKTKRKRNNWQVFIVISTFLGDRSAWLARYCFVFAMVTNLKFLSLLMTPKAVQLVGIGRIVLLHSQHFNVFA